MSIIRFDNVDVIFTKDPREALKLLDQGMTRNEILKKTGQIVGVEKAHIAGFNYSGAMTNAEGAWSYENLDAWLKSPAGYMKGTSMSFAGIKKDDERANLIMYLHTMADTPVALPTPEAAAAPAAEGAAPAPAEFASAGRPSDEGCCGGVPSADWFSKGWARQNG